MWSREKVTAPPIISRPPDDSVLGEGRGARGEGTPLPLKARGGASPRIATHKGNSQPARAPAPDDAVHIAACPLPATDSDCRELTAMLSAELSPLLSSAQRAHLAAFRQTRAACSRWLSRLALAACLDAAGAAPDIWLPLLEHRPGGAPSLPDWGISFSHSGKAAFAALLPATEESACIGLDAECLTNPPPHIDAFAPDELRRPVPLSGWERLRLWTLKESLAKAAGTGLTCPPAHIPAGRHGQRRGCLHWRERTLFWQTLALPGHWLALTGTRPLRPFFRLLSPEIPSASPRTAALFL